MLERQTGIHLRLLVGDNRCDYREEVVFWDSAATEN